MSYNLVTLLMIILDAATSLTRPEMAAAATLRAYEVVVLDVESMTLFSSFIKPKVPVCFEDNQALFSPSAPASSILH